MTGKLDEEYENQTKLNLSEIYSNEEIKLLRKSIPDINNIIYLVPNNEHINTDNSKSFNERTHIQQPQYRYFPSIRKIKPNLNTSFFIDKEKFYPMILSSIKQIFDKEKNYIYSKSLALIIEELLNISKIIKQNLVYYKFFKSVKDTKLNEIKKSTKSFSQKKKNIKVKFNLSIDKNNIKNDTYSITHNNDNYRIGKMNLSGKKESKLNYIDVNSLNVKKQLSFGISNEIDKNNKKKFSKSVCEILPKEKDNIFKGSSAMKDTYDINNNSKRNPSVISEKNKEKININIGKANKNMNKNNKNYILKNANQQKNSKKLNNNFLMGPNKILLKKTNYDNKKIGIYDLIHNKYDYNLTNNNQINKKNFRDKENLSKKNIEKIEKNNSKKLIAPINVDTKLYQNIETQEFNIFKLEKNIGRENILSLIGYYIFKYFSFDEIIKYNRFEKWSQKVADGYVRNNYYHNDLHAADVTHTCFLYFKLGEFETVHKFSKSNMCSLFLSCMCHDYQHPGVNNNFLKETNNKIAIRYNDASILENMHISKTFKLILNNREYNIFDGIEKNLYKQMRKEMISCVLATDMSFHNYYVDFLKKCVENKKEGKKDDDDDKKQKEDKNQNYMNLLIHSADISNPTKIFDIYFDWAKLVVEEFWDQGDKEKKLNLPCFCDRDKVTVYQSQLGFINFIEIPYFSVLAELNPKMKFFYDNLLNNKNILLSMQEKEKKEKDNQKEKEKSE